MPELLTSQLQGMVPPAPPPLTVFFLLFHYCMHLRMLYVLIKELTYFTYLLLEEGTQGCK